MLFISNVPSTSGGGTGDVVGPASSTDNNIAVFNGVTGKIIKDGGTTITAINSAISAKQDGDADLTAISALSTTGIAVRTGAGTWAVRDMTYPAEGLVITNSAGVSGNPAFSLANDLAALEGLSSTGIPIRTATDTWSQRTLDTDGTLAANSDSNIATQKATKTYVDTMVSGLLDYRGGYDASSNVYPSTGGSGTAGAVLKGDMWIVSVAGTLGGSAVQIGDSVIANVDTPGQTAGNWNILNANISYVPEDVANKATTMSGNTASDTKYLSAKAVYDWGVATFAALAGSISQAFAVSQLEVGHATDTSITRVSAGVIAVEGVTVPTISSTNTLTNKRVDPRVGTTTSSATPTINTDNYDMYTLTAQAVDITSFTTNLSGTPVNGQKLIIRITGTAARAITWGSSFAASTVALPTTTVTTAMLTVGFIYDTVSAKWVCSAVA